jgi:hypothetical protein
MFGQMLINVTLGWFLVLVLFIVSLMAASRIKSFWGWIIFLAFWFGYIISVGFYGYAPYDVLNVIFHIPGAYIGIFGRITSAFIG